MKLLVWEADKHIQANEFRVDDAEGFRSFWRDLQDKYMGFKIDFCYHNCDVPTEYMAEIDARLLESCIETRLSPDKFSPALGEYMLTPVTEENYADFAALHDRVDPDMYWTSERLIKDISRWLIYLYEDGYVLLNLYSDIAEIFALEATDRNIRTALLSQASQYAFEAGKSGVLYMVDDDADVELEMVQSIGFAICGKYIAYQATVK